MSPSIDADISLVLAFLNTVDIEEGTDLLRSAESWREWAAGRSLRAGGLDSARETREALRALAGDPGARGGAVGASVRVELTPDGPALVTDSAVGAVLAATARLSLLGELVRVKICPADNCLWAFYDQSRNRSRSWCSMRACGNREKARAWRQRAANSPDA